MDKTEFFRRLKEDKCFDSPEELIAYRLPVVQFYLSNYTNLTIINDRQPINSRLTKIEYNEETDFPLLNEAFLKIKYGAKGKGLI